MKNTENAYVIGVGKIKTEEVFCMPGLYYSIHNVSKKFHFSPLNYGQGFKEREHSWSGNSYLYELLILLKDEWKGDRFSNLNDYFIIDILDTDDPNLIDDYYLRKDYEDYTEHLLSYQDRGGYYMLDECWYERLPAMWQELNEQYVLVNYDKALYCEIDCNRSLPLEQRDCTLVCLLMWKTEITDSKRQHMCSWMFNRIGMERRDSKILDWMEDISFIFEREKLK